MDYNDINTEIAKNEVKIEQLEKEIALHQEQKTKLEAEIKNIFGTIDKVKLEEEKIKLQEKIKDLSNELDLLD